MDAWVEELSTSLLRSVDKDTAFTQILEAAKSLGFEYCAYGLRLPFPIAKPKFFLVNTYPAAWCRQYEEAGYLAIDPTVLHGRRTQTPLVWSDALFVNTPELWDGARSFGLAVGWAQSSFDVDGAVGMLTLARSNEPMAANELQANEAKMSYLANASHHILSRAFSSETDRIFLAPLTVRETEILKWLADGKTSREVSGVLHISFDTVNFHVKNAITKLGATNKTAAVARAILRGLLG